MPLAKIKSSATKLQLEVAADASEWYEISAVEYGVIAHVTQYYSRRDVRTLVDVSPRETVHYFFGYPLFKTYYRDLDNAVHIARYYLWWGAHPPVHKPLPIAPHHEVRVRFQNADLLREELRPFVDLLESTSYFKLMRRAY